MTQVALRPLRDADLAAAQLLSQGAGWPHRLEDWRLFRQFGAGIAACAAGGTLVGTAMWWPYGDDAATIGMVLVAPSVQGQGIGRLMMQAAMAKLGSRHLMLNSTKAGLRLYEALGFRAIGMVHQHQGEVQRSPSDGRARLLRPGEHGQAVALDATAFGASRASLLARLLADGDAVAVDGDAALGGFAVRRLFGRGRIIGPVIAADEDAAIALVAALLPPGFLRIDIPAEATRFAAWLGDAGLAQAGQVTTMLRGDWPAPPSRPRRFALISQALG